MFKCQKQVRYCLCLDSLGSIHNQQGPFAGSDGTRHFVAEVHVTGRINQVEHVALSIRVFIIHLHGMTLNRDTALPLQIHIVEGLRFQIPIRNRLRGLEQTIRKGAFPVVDMCNYTKITDILHAAKIVYFAIRISLQLVIF